MQARLNLLRAYALHKLILKNKPKNDDIIKYFHIYSLVLIILNLVSVLSSIFTSVNSLRSKL